MRPIVTDVPRVYVSVSVSLLEITVSYDKMAEQE